MGVRLKLSGWVCEPIPASLKRCVLQAWECQHRGGGTESLLDVAMRVQRAAGNKYPECNTWAQDVREWTGGGTEPTAEAFVRAEEAWLKECEREWLKECEREAEREC